MNDRRHRRSAIPPLLVLAVLLAAGAGLAACDALPATPFPSLPPATPAPTATEIATPEPTMVPPESLEPEPTDTDTGSAGTPPCAGDELKASRGITAVDGDERVTEVVLVAAETCSIDAWPTLLLEDGRDKVLVVANATGAGGIDLVGGVAYTSEVRLSNWCLGEPSYPVSIGIVEGVATVLVTGDSFPDEGDLPACLHQDADPVLSGTAWAPSP